MNDFIVGLDVSKRFHVAYTASQKKPFTFEHHRAGFEKFKAWLAEIALGQTPVFGMEPTGSYTRVLAHYLLQQGWRVNIVEGVHVKRIKLVYTNSPLKTDAVDARVIAELVAQGRCRRYEEHQLVYNEIRQLIEMYMRVSEYSVQTQNRIHNFVDTLFPELTLLQKQIKARTPRELLKTYPSPDQIAEADPEAFYQFIRKVSQGRVYRDRCQEIQQAAKANRAPSSYLVIDPAGVCFISISKSQE